MRVHGKATGSSATAGVTWWSLQEQITGMGALRRAGVGPGSSAQRRIIRCIAVLSLSLLSACACDRKLDRPIPLAAGGTDRQRRRRTPVSHHRSCHRARWPWIVGDPTELGRVPDARSKIISRTRDDHAGPGPGFARQALSVERNRARAGQGQRSDGLPLPGRELASECGYGRCSFWAQGGRLEPRAVSRVSRC
jgi:hypothetical protein